MAGNRGVMGMCPPRSLSVPSSPPPVDQELAAPPAPTPRGSSCWQPFPNLVPLCHIVSPSPIYPTPRCFPLGQGALNASSRDRATFVGAVGWLRGRGSSRRHLQPPRGLLGWFTPVPGLSRPFCSLSFLWAEHQRTLLCLFSGKCVTCGGRDEVFL